MNYSLPAFLVPFAFTLDPRGLGLLLQGDWGSIAIATGTAVVGTAALASAIGGWGFEGRPWLVRVGMGVAGALLLHPSPAADVAGAVLLPIVVAARFWYRVSRSGGGTP